MKRRTHTIAPAAGIRPVRALAPAPALALALFLAVAAFVAPGGGPLAAPAPAAGTEAGKPDAIEPGDQAPGFTLTDTEGKTHSLAAYLEAGRIVVLEWFNPECPFIRKHHALHPTFDDIASDYADRGVVLLAVNSGAPGKQGAGLDRNRKAKQEYGIAYPILLDESGEVGLAYGALATPHMFVIAPDGTLLYAGAIDDDRDARNLGKTNYVRQALDAHLAGEPVETSWTKPYGCSVKYRED